MKTLRLIAVAALMTPWGVGVSPASAETSAPFVTTACQHPSPYIVRQPWGLIAAKLGQIGSCTFRVGDVVCLQKQSGINSWYSVACRYAKDGAILPNGTETPGVGCTSLFPSNAGAYRGLAIIEGVSRTSATFFCPSDY